jgi:hypothetical protein
MMHTKFDGGHPDVLLVSQQQITVRKTHQYFIKYAWLHVGSKHVAKHI